MPLKAPNKRLITKHKSRRATGFLGHDGLVLIPLPALML